MKSRRCSPCDVNWPYADKYQQCPIHGTPTWEVGDGPITWAAAEEMVKEHNAKLLYEAAVDAERSERQRAFDQFYAEREQRRIEEEMEATLEQIRNL